MDDKQIAIGDISVGKLREAIPPHLFERSLLKSSLYLLENVFYVVTTLAVTVYLINNVLPDYLFWPTIAVYWFVEGTFATGFWVLAHECGHQAFCENKLINDIVGLVLHSSVFTPYYSWKISHGVHHRGIGHMHKDVVFVPITKKQYFDQKEAKSVFYYFRYALRIITGNGVTPIETNFKEEEHNEFLIDVPLMSFLVNWMYISGMLLLGWPLYLWTNLSGQPYNRWTSHFTPTSPLFDGKYDREVIMSNLGLIGMLSFLGIASYFTSLSTVAIFYIGPYLGVNAWLILITYLQHTDPQVPRYRDGGWTYVKGALATIDRNYGRLFNHLHHHVGDTHVVHHLFSRIPHYNAVAATNAIKPLLGEHYVCDNDFFLKSLYRTFVSCHYVDDEGEVVYFK